MPTVEAISFIATHSNLPIASGIRAHSNTLCHPTKREGGQVGGKGRGEEGAEQGASQEGQGSTVNPAWRPRSATVTLLESPLCPSHPILDRHNRYLLRIPRGATLAEPI